MVVGERVDLHENGFVSNWREDIDSKEKGNRPKMLSEGPETQLLTP